MKNLIAVYFILGFLVIGEILLQVRLLKTEQFVADTAEIVIQMYHNLYGYPAEER